jgi:hypothetical protein
VIGRAKCFWAVNDEPILVGTPPHENQHHENQHHETLQAATCMSRTFLCQVTIRGAGGEQVGTSPSGTDLLKEVPDRLAHGELEVLPLISGGLPTVLTRERSIG